MRVCGLRFYGPVNPLGSCRARSVYLITLFFSGEGVGGGGGVGAGLVLWAVYQYLCTFFRQTLTTSRMTVENISCFISTKEICRARRGSNPRPPDHQSDAHSTEPPRWNNCICSSLNVAYAILCHRPMVRFYVVNQICRSNENLSSSVPKRRTIRWSCVHALSFSMTYNSQWFLNP